MEVLPQPYHQGRLYKEKHLVALVLADIHNLVPEVLKQSPSACSLTLPLKGDSERRTLNPEHPMTKLLLAYAQLDQIRALELFADRKLCPYTRLLLQADAGLNVRFSLIFKSIEGCLFIQIYSRSLIKVKQLWGGLCKLSQGRPFKTALNVYHRVMRERLAGYHEYVHSLFAHSARLLLIRIDIGYGEGNTVTYEEFRGDLDHFIDLIQSDPVFNDLVGYIWTIEHGNSKGYHTHLLFFYDGSKRRGDCYIAQQIGDVWMQLSKRRNPVYFNCNTKENKQKYQICCIGEVHRDYLPEIHCLHEELIPYLLKVDEFLRLTKDDNRRLTGRGVSLFIPNEPDLEPEEEPDDELEFNALGDLW